MGTGGDVTHEYAGLLKDIWQSTEDKVYPVKILKKLS
jgi:hypothetical protein